jgi:alpha-beta hydrolase superfamily lysophospholipase
MNHASLATREGGKLAVYDWPLSEGRPPRAQVLLVHGLGEHAGRYGHVAARLNGWGYAVHAYDHHGHGRSDGDRGALPAASRLLDDLAQVIDATKASPPAASPLVLLGHSLGGLVAAGLVARRMRQVDALVLSSPALDAGLNPVQKLLVSVLPRLWPDLRVGNGLNANYLSHDPAVVRAYLEDPLVHDRVSARLARFIADEGVATLSCAATWAVPTLLLFAGQDRLVNPEGSRRFAAQAPGKLVQTRCFDDLYHEIFNELDAAPVFEALQAWMDRRYPA